MTSTFSRTYSTLALVAAMAAAPMIATAAPDGGSDNGPDGGMPHHHQKMQRGHDMQGRWSHSMLHRLNLTQAQQDQIFKIRHDQAQAFYDQRKALRAAAKSLHEITTANSFNQDQAKQAAGALGQAESQLALLRAQTQAQIRAVLTPEQRQKLAERWGHRGPHKAAQKAQS
jgi:Spy/CpxP family protein refolding chaperone